VRYVASFVIYQPIDPARASGLMWHDVPNRGRVFPFAPQDLAFGDIVRASAWQGDNAGATALCPKASTSGLQFLQVPVARGPGGPPVTGDLFSRIVNRCGPASQPLLAQTHPVPYKPMSLDTRESRRVSRGISQSGNLLRGRLHLGFNRAEDGTPVHDGLWSIIAGRRCVNSSPMGADAATRGRVRAAAAPPRLCPDRIESSRLPGLLRNRLA